MNLIGIPGSLAVRTSVSPLSSKAPTPVTQNSSEIRQHRKVEYINIKIREDEKGKHTMYQTVQLTDFEYSQGKTLFELKSEGLFL